MAFCPNFADEEVTREFNLIKSQVGENAAYWYWDRFEGDFKAISDALSSKGVNVQPVPNSPQIGLKSVSTGMSGDLINNASIPKINLAKHPIDEKNNQAIWDVENELGLISIRTIKGEKYKFYNAAPREDAVKLQTWILQNYLDVKVKLVPAWTGAGNEVGIKVEGYPKNVDKIIAEHQAMLDNQARIDREEIDKETREDLLPDPEIVRMPTDAAIGAEELEPLTDLVSNIGFEIHDARFVLNLLEKDFAWMSMDSRTNSVLKLLQQHANSQDRYELRFEIINEKDIAKTLKDPEDTYGYYSPTDKKIVIVKEQIFRNLSYNYFVQSILHEYIHAYTVQAINDPKTEEEKAFAKEMTKLWRTAKINAPDKTLHAYSNPKEFISAIMTNPSFQKEVQNIKYNLWYRIVKVISDLFGLNLVASEDVAVDEIAFKTIMEFIPTQSTSATEGKISRQAAPTAKELLNTIKRNIDITDRKGLVELVRSIEDEYNIDEVTDKVQHKKSKWSMLPVTTIMNQFSFGVNKEELKGNQELQDLVDRGGALGNVTHGTAENIFRGGELNIKNKLGLVSSPTLRADLKKIFKRFEGENITVISELYVADPYKGIVGKIDLVVIDDKNRVHIYDFKTKEGGFANWTKRFTNRVDGKLKYSDRQTAHAQMTIYKRMFEDITGLTVFSMNAILLEPTVEGNVVTGVKLAKQHDGVDWFNYRSPEGVRIDAAIRNIEARADQQDDFLSSIPGVNDPQRSYATESRLGELEYSALEFSKIDAALNKVLKELEVKLEFTKKRGTTEQIRVLENKLEEIKTQQNSADSLKVLVNFAIEETGIIRQTYFNKKEKGEEISIGQLYNWKNFVLAYEGFGDYAQYLATTIPQLDPNTTEGKKAKPEYTELLRQINLVMERVALVKNWYETESLPKLIKAFAPLYHQLRVDAKARFTNIYRNNPDVRQGLTEQEFVKKGLAAEEISINKNTGELLLNELRKASRDINAAGLWLDNMLDSKDPIAASMVKLFAKTEDLSHRQSLKVRDELLNVLRPFEKEVGDRLGLVSYKDIYDYMIEKDENGKHTNYFVVSKFNSAIWEERDEAGKLIDGYMKVVQDTRHLPEDEQDEIRKEWKNERTVMRSEDFRAARNEFIMSIYKDEKRGYELTEKDLATLRQYDIEVIHQLSARARDKTIPKPKSIEEFANNGGIPLELAKALDTWVYENAWEYRDIRPAYKKKYESRQWNDLLKHKEANDAKWKLYSKLMELMDEANAFLPYSSRIAARLPGVEKRTTEMLKDNMGIVATVKESVKKKFGVRKDDPERDNFTQTGEEKAFLPIHYTGNIGIDLQSFDIPTIVYKFWQSSNDYHNKIKILPEMELAKHFIKTRETDPINARKYKLGKRPKDKDELRANNNNLAKQVIEWFAMAVYGQPKKNQGKLLGADVRKAIDALSGYTALNLLGLNVVQGTANKLLGEVLQVTEQIAGEYMSKGAYRKGWAFYTANLGGILGDVGSRGAKNVVTKLLEVADILDEWEGTNFSQRQKFRQAMSTNTAFFTTHAGEHSMQGKFYLGMLSDKRAYNTAGEDIGDMLHQYSVNKETGELEINKEVDLEQSEWTEDDQFDFQFRIRGYLSRLHGEYSDLGRMALQRGAAGSMIAMFRKFVVPGYKRRWDKRAYVNRLEEYVEGSYLTTGRFFRKLIIDMYHLKFEIGANWHNMNDHEKANVRRTLSEVTFLVMTIILSNLIIGKLKDDDEDERFWSFMAYQALRLRAELLFFVWPGETMSILRSPTAVMSVAENLGRLLGQMMHPADLYERGPWKGQPKIYKTLTNMVPMYRQYYRLRDQRDQLPWFSSKIN